MPCVNQESGTGSRSRLKVLHVIDSMGGGGGAEHALRLQLPLLAQRGVESEVLCLRPRQGPLADHVRREGTPVRVLGDSGRIRAAHGLRSVIKEYQPDLVHATLFDSCFTSRIGTPNGIPLLNSVVNTPYDPVRVERLGAPRMKRSIVKSIDKCTARRVQHFHVLTQAVANDVHKTLGVDFSRMTVIPRGREASRFRTGDTELRKRIRRELSIPEDAYVYINVGRQDHQKAQSVLIASFAHVRRVRPNSVLVIVGREGTATFDIRNAISAGQLDSSVRVLGYRADVADLLACADVFVFPSFFEGLGSALIEAMATKLPIIASNIPAISEVLDAGRLGRLVPPGDINALAEQMLLAQGEGRRFTELAELGYLDFLEKFEIGRVVDRTVDLYRRVAC